MAFVTPRKAQNSSSPMRLPIELRLMILENILVYPAGIIDTYRHVCGESKRHPGGPQRIQAYLKHLQGSGQLLRTCQQLFIEGHSQLYEKTTLQIHIQGDNLIIMDVELYLGELEAQESVQLDLLEMAHSTVESFKNTVKDEPIQGSRKTIRMYPTLRKFKHFNVNVDYEDQEEVFVACRVLRHLLHDKHATFTPEPQWLTNRNATDFLEACAVLRCQSFTFNKFNDIEHIRTAITSSTPVHDTFPLWLNFNCHFFPMLYAHVGNYGGFFAKEKEDFSILKEHMLNYDMDACVRQQQLLMERAVEWIEEWAEDQINRLEAAVTQVKKERDNFSRDIVGGLRSNTLYPRLEKIQ